MPRFLRGLRINDVSSVDRGAGKGVKVMLVKRDVPQKEGAVSAGDVTKEIKRAVAKYSDNQERGEDGRWSSGGSASSASSGDRREGRAAGRRGGKREDDNDGDKDRGKTGGGVNNRVPHGQPGSGQWRLHLVGKKDFDDEMNEAISALNMSVCSILDDESVVDKSGAISESFDQFKEHVSALGQTEHDDDDKATMEKDMTKEELAEALNEAVAKSTADIRTENERLREQLNVAKMSDRHRNYYQTLEGETQKRFADAKDPERDEIIERTSKRYEDDPIYKSMRAENEELRKRLQSLEDSGALEVCKREAREMGVTAENAGEIRLRVKRGGADGTEALATWEKMLGEANGTLKSQNKELRLVSKAFTEIGTSRGATGNGSADDEIKAKAEELRKTDSKLTPEGAYVLVLEDPANRELAKRERDERMLKIHRAAV